MLQHLISRISKPSFILWLLFSYSTLGYTDCINHQQLKITNLLEKKQYKKAEKTATNLVKKSPTLDTYLALADVYSTLMIQKDDTDQWAMHRESAVKLEETLVSANQLWPKERSLYFCLLSYYQHTRQLPKFEALFQKALTQKVTLNISSNELGNYGIKFIAQREFQVAHKLYSSLLEKDPSNPDLLNGLGYNYFSQGLLSNASNNFERAYAINNNHLGVIKNLAETRIYQRRYPEAITLFKQALSLSSNEPSLHFDIALLTMTQSFQQSAYLWQDYIKAFEEDESQAKRIELARTITVHLQTDLSEQELYILAISFIRERYHKYAMPLLDILITHHPRNLQYSFALAQNLDIARFQGAALALALTIDSQSDLAKSKSKIKPETLPYFIGRLYFQLNQIEESKKYLEQVEAINSEMPNLQYLLGVIWSGLENEEQAMNYFKACTAKENNKKYLQRCGNSILMLAPKNELLDSET